jgi:hypothetical protein
MNAHIYIRHLIEQFPCLRSKLEFGGARWWDARGEFAVVKFMRDAGPWSSGEKQAARFIVTVWNPIYAKRRGWTFDLVHACSVLDEDNRHAVIVWMQHPRWP